MREYTDEEIQCFLEEDRLDTETLAKAHRLLKQSTPNDSLPSDGVPTQVRFEIGNESWLTEEHC